MFINKTINGNNLCNRSIICMRKERHWSQRQLAEQLWKVGIQMDKNQIQRIEAGKRFVTDIELYAFAKMFDCSLEELIK